MPVAADITQAGRDGRPTVLVVDDEAPVVGEIIAFLDRCGYDALGAESAESAQAVLALRDDVLVVLTDVRMAGINGLSLASAILGQHQDANEIGVIVMTGHAGLDEAVGALRAGASDFLRKPFRLAELRASMRKAVDRVALRRAAAERTRAMALRIAELEKQLRFGSIEPERPAGPASSLGEGDLTARAVLLHALGAGEIVPHFQPVHWVRDAHICGMEALARWHAPGRGLLLPAQFLPMAEAAGVQADLDWHMIRAAAVEYRRWRAAGASGLVLFVNLCARTLEDPALLEKLTAILAEAGLPPGQLAVEVAESVLLAPALRPCIRALRELGVQIVLDGFGVQQSSPASFFQLPVSMIKLDRDFLFAGSRIDDARKLLAGLARLGHDCGLQVAVEGVETDPQFRAVVQAGIDLVQGHRFSRSVDAEQAMVLVGRRQR